VYPTDAQGVEALRTIHVAYVNELRRERGIFDVPPDGEADAIHDPTRAESVAIDTKSIGVWFTRYLQRYNELGGDHAGALGTIVEALHNSDEAKAKRGDQPVSPVASVTGPLRIQGPDFIDPDGRIFKWRGVAGFAGFQRWLEGERGQLEDFAGWMQSIGANAWAFFCMWSVTAFDPRRYPRYYDECPHFLEWLEAQGFRPWPVLACDQDPARASGILMSRGELDAHKARLEPALAGRTGELFNEPYQNGIDICRSWGPVPGALIARGQYADDAAIDSVGTVLDFSTKSFARKFQWPRTAKDLFEIADATGKPGVGREPPAGIYERTVPWSRSDDPRAFAAWHGAAELLGAGSFIHGDRENVQSCLKPGPRAQACVDAIAAIWASQLPANGLSAGRYTRGGLGDCPLQHRDRYDDGETLLDERGTMRTFGVIQGNEATCLAIMPGPGWRPEGDHGWTVVEQRGPFGEVVLARR